MYLSSNKSIDNICYLQAERTLNKVGTTIYVSLRL